MKETPSTQSEPIPILRLLDAKLAELLALREELETREESFTDIEKRKALVQQIIDLTHQIQALRVVIGLFSEED